MCRLSPPHVHDAADPKHTDTNPLDVGSQLQQDEQRSAQAQPVSGVEDKPRIATVGNSGEEQFLLPAERDSFSFLDQSYRVDWRAFLPERVDVDIEKRYKLDRLLLGEGGDGKVMVGRDVEQSGRRVAVKKVAKTSAKKTASFRTEIQIMKELDHPNICKLLETFEHGRYLFYVMELYEGGEVFDSIIAQGVLQEALAAEIVAQVASALRYAHGRGIAHRDIKPENICFATTDKGDPHVKLIDWGLGRCFRDTVMRSSIGSQVYAAPEVITAKTSGEYTSAVDLWSLGVLAYVMLSGSPPFWGSWSAQLASMQAQRYPLAGGVWDSISEEAIGFIRALLKPAPEERLPIDEVLDHQWLKKLVKPADSSATREVLGNCCANGSNSLVDAVCRAVVARHVDHRHLCQIRKVFQGLDEDGDGQLSLAELRQGLGRVFGWDSAEFARSEELFRYCNLDGSGAISFTEFCAMGLGPLLITEDDAVWAAFKALDVEGQGQITFASLKGVLRRVGAQGAWPTELAEELARKIIGSHCSSENALDFEAWRELVRCSSKVPNAELEVRAARSEVVNDEGNDMLQTNLASSGEERSVEVGKVEPEPTLADLCFFAGA